ncbi:MAG: hypothetical protein WC043_00005, partial [Pseudobdellovibrionaceae bacterium]
FPRAGLFRFLKAGEGQISAHLPSTEEPCTGPLAPEVLCGANALASLHHASFPPFPEFLKKFCVYFVMFCGTLPLEGSYGQ